MKIIKKSVVLILCFGLLLGMLSGCRTEDPAPATEPQVQATTATEGKTWTTPSRPWKLEDLVADGYAEEFSWIGRMDDENNVRITLPTVNPNCRFAEEYNEKIARYTAQLESEIRSSKKSGTSATTLEVSYRAYLNGDTLSIVITETFSTDYIEYTVDSFDLEDQEAMSVAELSDEYLDLDYPAFLLATNALIEQEFEAKYSENGRDTDPALYKELLASVSTDVANILARQLYVGENGQLMLVYNAPAMAGGGYLPTVAPLDLHSISWTNGPTETESYDYLFTLTNTDDNTQTGYNCGQILRLALEEDADDFAEQLAKRSQEEIDNAARLLVMAYGEYPARLQRTAQELENETVKNAILNALRGV